MNKSVKKMALLSVLSVAAVGCQKETVTVEPQIGVEASDTVYTVRVSQKAPSFFGNYILVDLKT